MDPRIFRAIAIGAAALSFALAGSDAAAEPRHGIAMYGEPALPPDFVSLPYANPDAPKGGRIVVGEVGSFDSLNPHILKGVVPWQWRFLGYESLMGRSYDEPFTLYGLLAESIEVAEDRSWAEFTLREEAAFSDGTPVTIEDVMWSYETLGTEGHPRYLGTWNLVETMEQTGPRSVRFTFATDNRELALLIGMRPILKKAQWADKDFTRSGLDTIPIGTAPYVVSDYEAGRFVELSRNPDYWGSDLPFMRGQANLDTIRMEFYADAQVLFEAFKAGQITSIRETNAEKWATQYDFPAVRSGDIVKSEIPHERPTGMTGFVMNTRRSAFSDWRVRAAMIHAFNFEFINETLTGGRQPRITSYFSNSLLAMADGPADEGVRRLLQPHVDALVPGALDAYALPQGDGSAANRRNLRTAMRLMEEAGFTIEEGRMTTPSGEPFGFEILLPQSTPEAEVGTIVDLFLPALERMGIDVRVARVDRAQFEERTDAFDFDMTFYTRGLSLSPGNEQKLYWGSAAAEAQGSLNWMGVQSPAVDAMIDAILTSESRADFVTAAKALDRVLTTGRYVIPIYQFRESRIAHDANLHFPDDLPIYGDFINFHPDVWWYEPD
ncbi:Oligopeptide-binding protein AppA precursor [Roseivivax jejudonensis]|uniref:Oligopeptide-binding protein AppA n=1 Tax=Roseivivax jejudonensis TaxID=1529041 RepID=A0A1X6YRG9_9RHOB|nr:extracellular solute-binding protein [Roseivivax jejudonensis]SLN28574.1 Oligopeptide-binding protein AppA precursor [Roseivivax jejudonensis]